MLGPPTYGEMLANIEERTAAMQVAIAGADDRNLSVPDCPGWTLGDLMKHVGVVQREWAAAVPGEPLPPAVAAADAVNEGGLTWWLQRSTYLLTHALRTAGPQVATGMRWYSGGPPMTGHDVARRQMQEAAVHAYDAQLTVRREQLLANDVAVDGIDEFLRRRLAARGPWPYRPARVEVEALVMPGAGPPAGLERSYHITWLLDLDGDGARVTAGERGEPAVRVGGPAGDVLLLLYRRTPYHRASVHGNERLFAALLDWADLG
jgi:uncharacterized protein (TIGR03083 family)